MKKSFLHTTLLAATAAIIAMGCGGDDGGTNNNLEVGEFVTMFSNKSNGGNVDDGTRYSLSVEVSPIGSGYVTRKPDSLSYKTQSQVTVTAKAADGYRFVGWSGMVNDTTESITITMSRDMEVKANFTSIYTTPYTLSVNSDPSNGGTVSRNPNKVTYTYGDSVTVTATPADGYVFVGWSGASSSTESTVKIITDSNKVLTANFVVGYTVTISSIGVGATESGCYAKGTTVNITAGAAPAGHEFKNWTTTSNGVIFADANSAATTFNMPSNNVTVTANFIVITYPVTIQSVGTGVTGDGRYAEGATVKITAGTAPVNKIFRYWTSRDVTFADQMMATTTFNMPSHAVTVTANFDTTYIVTIESIGSGATGGGRYAQGATVNITAGTTPIGKVFSRWTTTNNDVRFDDHSSETTTFSMPSKNDVTVTANYVNFQLGTFTDTRNNKTYPTTTIDGKTWMAENLNYDTAKYSTYDRSMCYDFDSTICAKYGRLYTWEAAMMVCPTGWHLPSRQEWIDLVIAAGGIDRDPEGWYFTSHDGSPGKKLKSNIGWYWNDTYDVSGNGTNDFGFGGSPGGGVNRDDYYSFPSPGYDGVWWTATEYSNNIAYYVNMSHSNFFVMIGMWYIKKSNYSVRCVQD